MSLPDRQGLLVSSHPRSGTHLMIDVLRRQFPSTRSWRLFGRPLDHLYLNLERLVAENRRFDDAMALRIVARPRRPLMKTHFLADFSESWVADESGPMPPEWRDYADRAMHLYVHRDPRDVMASYKQFLSSIVPGVAEMTLGAFMRSPHWSGGEDRLGWWVRHVEGWRAVPGVMMVGYAALVKSPAAIIGDIEHMLGEASADRQPLLPPKVEKITDTRRHRLFSLAPHSTAIIADRQRFPLDDWRTALSPEDHGFIAQRAGGVMRSLGYDPV